MGVFGEEHTVKFPGVNGIIEGKSKLYLFPGQHKRIFNTDETNVSSNDTRTNRACRVTSENHAPTSRKPKAAQVHCTYVGLMSMPEYDRDELRTRDKDGNPVVVEAAKFEDGHAWPGMVCLQTFSRLFGSA